MGFSMKARTGPVLEEALKRYKLNAVLVWSTLYGANLARPKGTESPAEIARSVEWTTIIGDCWRIPHDNRVTLCFPGLLEDTTSLIQVRNFLSHFHRSRSSSLSKSSNFNIWDWFDTGISAYWFPGQKTSGIPEEVEIGSKIATNILGQSHSDHISPLIAPWRRIMYVLVSSTE